MSTSWTRLRTTLAAALALAAFAPLPFAAHAAASSGGAGDATVIAVIDSGFSPYHWDFLSSKMPQAATKTRADDLPLSTAPDRWLPGFASKSQFASYGSLKLHLDQSDDSAKPADMDKEDTGVWSKVQYSKTGDLHYYWLPGTKVIGAMTFGASDDAYRIHGKTDEHGMGTTSVSVGNIHGTCPECLLVFLQYSDQASAEQAINWAMSQPWIDGISNSYGFGSNSVYGRDRIYSGSNTSLQRAASSRGQTVFFSAGNGLENAFVTPTTTLESSQEGPDWIVTVGAVGAGSRAAYSGPGKPVDLAAIGDSYPSAYGATNVTNGDSFSGTSNATPMTAGTYLHALYNARRAMVGASRIQRNGVIATGKAHCGRARRGCEIGDGKLTAVELRDRLMNGAVHTGKGLSEPLGITSAPPAADSAYLAEGHGYYQGRLKGDDAYATDMARVVGPLLGTSVAATRPADEHDFFVVDSWCRQRIWGEWLGGYYRGGALPADNSNTAPSRSTYHQSCNELPTHN